MKTTQAGATAVRKADLLSAGTKSDSKTMKETLQNYRYWAEARRKEFPLLSRIARSEVCPDGVPLAYLDNAATTQKPEVVIEALSQFYRRSNANVHRGVYLLAEEATALYESSRNAVAAFLGAGDPRRIVFTRSATEALNLAAAAFTSAGLSPGDEILLSEMEHHSNLVPWQLAAERHGLRLRFIPLCEDGTLEVGKLNSLMGRKTKLVALTHVSNVLGTVNDVRPVIACAHARGIPVLLDAAQSIPHFPVDVTSLDCDFLAFSGHKVYGPMGIGVLYAKTEHLEALPPYQGGGEMIESVWLERSTWNEIPYKFEAGTPNVAGAVALRTALAYLNALGRDRVAQYEQLLTEYALTKLKEIPGVTLYGDPPERAPVIAFNLAGVHAHDVAQFLSQRGVAVRAGHHCAYPLLRKLGVPATVRASFSFYNTEEEIDRLVEGLLEAQEFFHRVC